MECAVDPSLATDHLPGVVAEGDLVGEMPCIQQLRQRATDVAPRRATVLIVGETGTGKELLARYIHWRSDRAEGPFVAVDCSTLTDTLFESQLFGHAKGAFTGATFETLGFIRAANGGTLFLDEIGELSLMLQAKLLRVLQERVVTPLGSTRNHPVDLRLIVATHRDLAVMAQQAKFRPDLYYRLNVVCLTLPPLRDRRPDLPLLTRHFLEQQAALYGETAKELSAPAQRVLLAHGWPGNVRELANVIEHAHVVCRGARIELADLPKYLLEEEAQAAPAGAGEGGTEDPLKTLCLRELERRAIVQALRRTGGKKVAACKLLGINLRKLNRRLAALGIREL